MTVAAARFFAADWESSSFIEFFVDLQLRVADDRRAGVGRTAERLTEHARFALQMTIVRSVDSYLAYLAETEAAVVAARRDVPWKEFLQGHVSSGREGVPIDAGERYLPALAHGNVRQLSRLFFTTTKVELFPEAHEVETFARLVSLRNLIAHGRTFASDDLVSLVDETASVGGLGLRWTEIREDFDYLRTSVVRIDGAVAEYWQLRRPISKDDLFAAISAAAKISEGASQREDIQQHWLSS